MPPPPPYSGSSLPAVKQKSLVVLEINSQGKPRPHSEPPGLVAGSLADHWQDAFRPGVSRQFSEQR